MKINKVVFEGKNYEQALLKAEDKFGLSEEEMIIEVLNEGTKGILGIGGKSTKIEVIPYSYIAVYVEEFIIELLSHFNLDGVSVEASYNNNVVEVAIDSENNGVLIGKNGRTLNALILVVTQAARQQIGSYVKVSLNISNYKDARIKQLERIAHKVSRSVAKTKIEAKLEPMNSFERRVIHEYLSGDKFVTTTSEGDEPKRYVVIKLK